MKLNELNNVDVTITSGVLEDSILTYDNSSNVWSVDYDNILGNIPIEKIEKFLRNKKLEKLNNGT